MEIIYIVLFLALGFGTGALLTSLFLKLRETSGKNLDHRRTKQDLELNGIETKVSEPKRMKVKGSPMVSGPESKTVEGSGPFLLSVPRMGESKRISFTPDEFIDQRRSKQVLNIKEVGSEKMMMQGSPTAPKPGKIIEGSGPLSISIPTVREYKHTSFSPVVFSPLWKDVEPSKKVETKTESVLHTNRYPSLRTNSQLAQKYLASIEEKNRKKISIIGQEQSGDSVAPQPVILQKEAESQHNNRIFGESLAMNEVKNDSISTDIGDIIPQKQVDDLPLPNLRRRLSIVTERRCSTKTFGESLAMNEVKNDSISTDIGDIIPHKQVDDAVLPNLVRRLSIVSERPCSTKTFAESLAMNEAKTDSDSAHIGNSLPQKQVDNAVLPNLVRRLSIVTERRCSTETFDQYLAKKEDKHDSISAVISNTIPQKQADVSVSHEPVKRLSIIMERLSEGGQSIQNLACLPTLERRVSRTMPQGYMPNIVTPPSSPLAEISNQFGISVRRRSESKRVRFANIDKNEVPQRLMSF